MCPQQIAQLWTLEDKVGLPVPGKGEGSSGDKTKLKLGGGGHFVPPLNELSDPAEREGRPAGEEMGLGCWEWQEPACSGSRGPSGRSVCPRSLSWEKPGQEWEHKLA